MTHLVIAVGWAPIVEVPFAFVVAVLVAVVLGMRLLDYMVDRSLRREWRRRFGLTREDRRRG